MMADVIAWALVWWPWERCPAILGDYQGRAIREHCLGSRG